MRETIRRLGTVNAQPRAGVSHVGDGLERWQSEHYGMTSQTGNGRKVQRLRSPRTLKTTAASADAWQLADNGKAPGLAYLLEDGWQWLGVAEHGDFATVLSIDSDGNRSAVRYAASDPEITEAEFTLEGVATATAPALTPDDFARILDPAYVAPAKVEKVAPLPVPLKWTAGAARLLLMTEPGPTRSLEDLHLSFAGTSKADRLAATLAEITESLAELDRQRADLDRRQAAALGHLEAARAALAA